MFQSDSFQSNSFSPAALPGHDAPQPGHAEFEPYIPLEIYPFVPFYLIQTHKTGIAAFVSPPVVSNPPPYRNVIDNLTILQSWQPADPLPTLPKLLNPQLTAVRVDNPPSPFAFSVWLPQDLPLPQTSSKLTQGLIPATAQVPFANYWLATVLQAWQPADPVPTLPKLLSPGIPGQSVDNPPFVHRTQLAYPEAEFRLPQTAPHYPQQFVAATVQTAFSNAWMVTVLQAWQPPPPLPTLPRLLNPSLTAVRVDNPPFTSRTVLPTILQIWEPPPPLPTPSVTFKIVQPGAAPATTVVEWLIRARRRGRR